MTRKQAGNGIVLAALTATALCAAPTAQAATPQPPIEILSPQRGAVHVLAGERRALRVRVRVAPRVRALRVIVSGRRERVVTRRFRSSGGVRTARLRLGRELSRGPGALRIRGRLGRRVVVASSHFWISSRRTEMLRVAGMPRRTGPRPLALRMRTAARVEDVRVRVNGHDARAAFSRTLAGGWRGSVSASHGLRFGRNRITITAYDRRGGFERVRRVVRVRRGRPLAGAGVDVRVRQRRSVRLNGRRTLPRRDERLRFSWRIVQRPKGSKARLTSADAPRPFLRPDRPGTYRVRLSVRPRGTAQAAAAAAAGRDVVTVAAQPAAPPRGTPVQTIAAAGQSGPGIQVGAAWYPMPAGAALQVLVLDGTTLQPIVNQSAPGTDGGAQFALDLVEDSPTDAIVIATQPAGRPVLLTDRGATAIGELFSDLGVEPDGSNARFDGSGLASGWSVVGTPGARVGRALVGVQQAPDAPVGAMSGHLQAAVGSSPDAGSSASDHVFNWPATFNQFDTRSGGDGATFNEMTIAGQTYRSGAIAAGASAFHLVWLDGGTLTGGGQATIPGDQGRQLAETLAGIANGGPAMLFMTTIGHPNIPRAGDDGSDAGGWAAAADQVAAFGGNRSAFLSLDGSGNADYSLAGASASGEQAPNAGADVSRILRPGVPAPRIVGVLDRRPGGAYAPASGGAPSAAADVAALVPDIKRVLAQPDQPFAPFDGPGEAEAERYIAEELGISAADPDHGIRANYWDPGLYAQWANLRSDIRDPNVVPPCPTAPCSQGFAAVQAQLDREFDAVAKVRTYFGTDASGTLYNAFTTEFISGAYGFDEVAESITSKYPPQEDEASGPSPFDVIEGMLDLSAELVPEGGEALGVAGAAIEIAGAFGDGGGATGYAGATVFEARASQFASILEKTYTDNLLGLDRIADLLVSDAGRLQAAGAAVLDAWQVDGDVVGPGLERSIAAYMWTSLLPTAFQAQYCVTPPVYYPPEDFRPAPWYAQGKATPPGLRFTPFAAVTHWPPRRSGGWGQGDTPGRQVGAGYLTVGGEIAGDFTYLGGDVAGQLFGPIDAGDPTRLGLLPAYLLAPQPSDDAPGFAVNEGSYDTDDSDQNGYVRYFCADGDEWREDTNVRGQ